MHKCPEKCPMKFNKKWKLKNHIQLHQKTLGDEKK